MCTAGECESFALASNQPYATSIALDGAPDGFVYFTRSRFAPDGIVGRVKKSGDDKVEVLYKADPQAASADHYLIDRPGAIALVDDRVVWTSLNGADGPYGRVHWANQDGSNHGSIGAWNGPADLAVDSSDVLYWTNRWDPVPVMRVDASKLRAGCAVSALYEVAANDSEDAIGLRADPFSDGSIFYCTKSGLKRVPKSGGAPTTLAALPCIGLAIDSTFAYFVHDSVVYRHDVFTASGPTEAIVDLGLGVDDDDHFTNIVFDGHYLYVARFDRDAGSILRVTTDGKEVLVLASKIQMAAGIATDDRSVYWTSQLPGEIRRIWK